MLTVANVDLLFEQVYLLKSSRRGLVYISHRLKNCKIAERERCCANGPLVHVDATRNSPATHSHRLGSDATLVERIDLGERNPESAQRHSSASLTRG